MSPYAYLAIAVLGIGFFVWLRLSGRKEGKQEVKLETAEKVIEQASKANSISKRVDGLGAIDLERLRDQLNQRD
jgi:macrodomain Ter protein organizer (MatP/YcbG family)